MKTRNKQVPFSRLTKAAQRIAIAQDIIAQLKAKKAIAKSNVFLAFNGISEEDAGDLCLTLREVRSKVENCSVCAIGAIMLSQLNINGDIGLDQANTYCHNGNFAVDARKEYSVENELSPYVTKYFKADQLQKIEIAFELGGGAFYIQDYLRGERSEPSWEEFNNEFNNGVVISEQDARDAVKFGKRYKNITNRMIAIMQNIIDNNGEFVP
jgi:hypothetical protein